MNKTWWEHEPKCAEQRNSGKRSRGKHFFRVVAVAWVLCVAFLCDSSPPPSQHLRSVIRFWCGCRFKSGDVTVLVATDLAARGLDIAVR